VVDLPEATARYNPRMSLKRVRGYAGSVLIISGVTALASLLRPSVESSDLTMLYLLGVVVVAISFGLGPAIAAAVLGVSAFDFLFVPPHFTFRVSDARYFVTFGVMLIVAAITGTLTARLRDQRERALVRERRIGALYRLSHDLALQSGATDVLATAVQHVEEVLGVQALATVPAGEGDVEIAAGDRSLLETETEKEAARWCLRSGRPAGLPTPGDSGSRVLHMPLVVGTSVRAVLSLRPREAQPLDPERLDLLRAFSSLSGLALERCRMADEARRTQTEMEAERARSALLSSVSHDLRTPLAAITGAATTLRDEAYENGPQGLVTRRELAETIADEAHRLNRLIGNLLDMTRLESGTLRVHKEWHSLEEIVGVALTRLGPELHGREIQVSLTSLPLIPMDDVLFEQVVRNLVDNAVKHSGSNKPILLEARLEDSTLCLEVADFGKGLPPGDEGRVFEKFYRGHGASVREGAGLGLAICRGIVEAHGGTVEAANRAGGGALFTVRLPIEGSPPTIESESLPEPHEANP
jgi:two-component system sensor histidine kinase KdpD